MKRCLRCFFGIILGVWFGGGLANGLQSDIRPIAAKISLLINGEVTIIKNSSNQWVISPYFFITRQSDPVSGLLIKVEGVTLQETMPGQYAGVRITHIKPMAGNSLRFVIEAGKKIPAASIAPNSNLRIEGAAIIGPMAQILNPAANAVINLPAATKSIAIQWKGGSPAFTLSVLKNNPGSPLQVFTQNNILNNTYSLAASLLAAGQNYSLGISHGVGKFTLKINKNSLVLIQSSSEVIVRYTVFSDFSISKFPYRN
jgi:hypothetical protein